MPRAKYTDAFKTKIILAILQGDRTLLEICSAYSISPDMVCQWKQEFLENAHFAFSAVSDRKAAKRRVDILQRKNVRMKKTMEQLMLECDFLQDCFRKVGAPIPKLPGDDFKE